MTSKARSAGNIFLSSFARMIAVLIALVGLAVWSVGILGGLGYKIHQHRFDMRSRAMFRLIHTYLFTFSWTNADCGRTGLVIILSCGVVLTVVQHVTMVLKIL